MPINPQRLEADHGQLCLALTRALAEYDEQVRRFRRITGDVPPDNGAIADARTARQEIERDRKSPMTALNSRARQNLAAVIYTVRELIAVNVTLGHSGSTTEIDSCARILRARAETPRLNRKASDEK